MLVRTSISLHPDIHKAAVKRAAETRCKTFSDYVARLIEIDVREKPNYRIVREEPGGYKTPRLRYPEVRLWPAHVTTDASGKLTEVDAAFRKMCGYSEMELLGKKPGSVLQGPETEQTVVAQFREAIRQRRPFECTLTNYHKDGRAYRVHIQMRPLFKNRKLTGFTAIEEEVE